MTGERPAVAAPTRRLLLRTATRAAVVAGLGRWLGGSRLLFADPLSPCLAGEPGEILRFALEPDLPTGVLIGEGLDARRYAPLGRALEGDGRLLASEHYVRTGVPPGLPVPTEWTITVAGAVRRPITLGIRQLLETASDQGEVAIECAGNGRPLGYGLLSAAAWAGVPLGDVLDRVEPTVADSRWLVEGHDEHRFGSTTSTLGCSWILSRDEIDATGAFLAVGIAGGSLTPELGAPVRLVVPGWYGCAAIKWVRRLVAVGPDAASTGQMIEFAGRTHQHGTPSRAVDYRPPVVPLAALPVRVQWRRLGDQRWLAVSGLAWGGESLSPGLEIRFRPDQPWRPLDFPPRRPRATTWSIWHHRWEPEVPGRYLIQLRPAAEAGPRLGTGFYARAVEIG